MSTMATEAVRLETTIEKDGELLLLGLPFRREQKVEVIILSEAPAPTEAEPHPERARPPIWERLAGLGVDVPLPFDLAEQHDHYAHGTPKR